jgi:GNAT superfamily N-acetyltransferase
MFQIRPFVESDLPYVTSSFYREYCRSEAARGSAAGVLDSAIKVLLGDPAWKTDICHLDGFPDEICGWMTWHDPTVLGWLDVKSIYRGRGIARALLAHANVGPGHIDTAFMLPSASKIAFNHGLNLHFRPYLAFPRNVVR